MEIKQDTADILKSLKDFFIDFTRDLTSLAGLPIYSIYIIFFLLSKNYTAAVQLLIGGIAIWAIIYPIRIVYYKPRPNEQSFTNILERLDASSFPSIHAGRTGVLALVFTSLFEPPILKVFIWIIALSIFASRIVLRKHHLEDVIVGALIGLVLGALIIKYITIGV